MPLLLIVDEATFIAPAIAIDEDTEAMHLIILEIAFIVAAIGPAILTMPLHLVVHELAFIARIVKHFKLTVPVTETILVLTFELAVMPQFHTLSMLLIVQPGSLIRGVIAANKLALSILHIVFPVALVVAAIWI